MTKFVYRAEYQEPLTFRGKIQSWQWRQQPIDYASAAEVRAENQDLNGRAGAWRIVKISHEVLETLGEVQQTDRDRLAERMS